MESLYLDGNKLSDLEGFTNSLFPRLNALGIANNNFNCTYLKHFMRGIDWEQIRLPVDRMPLNIHKTNIRGVVCDSTENDDNLMKTKPVAQLSSDQSHEQLSDALRTLKRHFTAIDAADNDSNMKIIRLPRYNGSNIMIFVW